MTGANLGPRATTTGGAGEALARAFLEGRGLKFRAANVRAPLGEIDLVFEDPATRELVCAEVKTRRGTRYGAPEESLTARKRRKLRQLVAWYAARIGWTGRVRLDVIGVLLKEGGAPVLTHTPYVGL